jgi:hypothetical protein
MQLSFSISKRVVVFLSSRPQRTSCIRNIDGMAKICRHNNHVDPLLPVSNGLSTEQLRVDRTASQCNISYENDNENENDGMLKYWNKNETDSLPKKRELERNKNDFLKTV